MDRNRAVDALVALVRSGLDEPELRRAVSPIVDALAGPPDASIDRGMQIGRVRGSAQRQIDAMQIGDSIFFASASRARSFARSLKYNGFRPTMRAERDGWRVWMVSLLSEHDDRDRNRRRNGGAARNQRPAVLGNTRAAATDRAANGVPRS